VGVELELHTLEHARGLVDIHDERRHLAVDLDAPMAIAAGIGLKVDALHGSSRKTAPPAICIYADFCRDQSAMREPRGARHHNAGTGGALGGAASRPADALL